MIREITGSTLNLMISTTIRTMAIAVCRTTMNVSLLWISCLTNLLVRRRRDQS